MSFQVEKPVCCLPHEPLSGPDMENCWVFWGLVLWLMAPYLGWTHESAPHQEWTHMVPQHSNWLGFKLGEHGCPSRTPNCSTCHCTAGGWNWFEACYEKSMGYLRRTKALWWLVSGQRGPEPFTFPRSPVPPPSSGPNLFSWLLCASPLFNPGPQN